MTLLLRCRRTLHVVTFATAKNTNTWRTERSSLWAKVCYLWRLCDAWKCFDGSLRWRWGRRYTCPSQTRWDQLGLFLPQVLAQKRKNKSIGPDLQLYINFGCSWKFSTKKIFTTLAIISSRDNGAKTVYSSILARKFCYQKRGRLELDQSKSSKWSRDAIMTFCHNIGALLVQSCSGSIQKKIIQNNCVWTESSYMFMSHLFHYRGWSQR